MACELIPIGSQDCFVSDGGIRSSYVTDVDNITAVTFDVNDQITGFTMTGTGLWTQYEMDTETDTAYYNQNGERQGRKHIQKQVAFMQFGGLDNDKRNASKALTACCALVAIHFMNNGKAQVQGLERVGDSGNLYQTTKKRLVATANLLTDTGANEDRFELTLNSESRIPSHFTTLTETAVNAL